MSVKKRAEPPEREREMRERVLRCAALSALCASLRAQVEETRSGHRGSRRAR